MSAPRSLSAKDLARRLESGEPIQLVDVREDRELDIARLPQPVVHLPLSRSVEWIPRLSALLRPEEEVVVLCHAGVRSWHFACWLQQEHGFRRVWNLNGGIDAWSVDVDPRVPRY
jgi:rhodanese-related sulfurtransferase